MIGFPNAKINLGLNVIERRADGYHNLETVFYPVTLSDILEILPGKSFHFEASGLALEGDPENNLVVRAYRLLNTAFNLPPVNIFLHKVIPFGAGLGGGSSDAAHTLKLLNEMFELNLSNIQLNEYAVKLGADCPFFIENQPSFATGTGNILSPINIDLSEYQMVIVKPPFGVETVWAYQSITPRKPRKSISEIINQPIETWREELTNDFECTVFEKYPQIGSIKQALYDNGAVYASMSGSGSSVYGIFRKVPSDLASVFDPEYFLFV